MKIIQVHNYYQQAGGEDAVVEAERALLEAKGNIIVPYYKNNEALGVGRWALGMASLQTLWNGETYSEFRNLLKNEKPGVVHCHNTFPLISPSIYWACAKENVPVVQTLHNYRLLCLNAFLFRQDSRTLKVKAADGLVKDVQADENDAPISTHSTCNDLNDGAPGAICELCVNKRFKWPGIRYSCYRDSRPGSLVIALMLFIHKLIGTWSNKVTAYIALTEFQKQKMIEGGLPGDKIWVKPNFIQTTDGGSQLSDLEELTFDARSLISGQQRYALFVGRLSPEKGCDVLIRAWALFEQQLAVSSQRSGEENPSSDLCPSNFGNATSDMPSSANNKKPQLLIVGDGPERASLEQLALHLTPNTENLTPQNIRFLGKRSKIEVLHLMRNAQFLISPSVCYETFGLVVLEAGLLNTPSIVAEPGAVSVLIDEQETGLLFPMGDAEQLAEKMAWAFEHSQKMEQLGIAAHEKFKANYAAEVNYQTLMNLYLSLVDCSSE